MRKIRVRVSEKDLRAPFATVGHMLARTYEGARRSMQGEQRAQGTHTTYIAQAMALERRLELAETIASSRGVGQERENDAANREHTVATRVISA